MRPVVTRYHELFRWAKWGTTHPERSTARASNRWLEQFGTHSAVRLIVTPPRAWPGKDSIVCATRSTCESSVWSETSEIVRPTWQVHYGNSSHRDSQGRVAAVGPNSIRRVLDKA